MLTRENIETIKQIYNEIAERLDREGLSDSEAYDLSRRYDALAKVLREAGVELDR